MFELNTAMTISTTGMKAQSARIKVISENIANSDTTASTPGGDPYTRKTISFKNVMDRDIGAKLVEVDRIGQDRVTSFTSKYMPDSPAADINGLVKMPNVDPMIELMDMKEAQRSYEASLSMVEQSRNMMMQTIDIMRRS